MRRKQGGLVVSPNIASQQRGCDRFEGGRDHESRTVHSASLASDDRGSGVSASRRRIQTIHTMPGWCVGNRSRTPDSALPPLIARSVGSRSSPRIAVAACGASCCRQPSSFDRIHRHLRIRPPAGRASIGSVVPHEWPRASSLSNRVLAPPASAVSPNRASSTGRICSSGARGREAWGSMRVHPSLSLGDHVPDLTFLRPTSRTISTWLCCPGVGLWKGKRVLLLLRPSGGVAFRVVLDGEPRDKAWNYIGAASRRIIPREKSRRAPSIPPGAGGRVHRTSSADVVAGCGHRWSDGNVLAADRPSVGVRFGPQAEVRSGKRPSASPSHAVPCEVRAGVIGSLFNRSCRSHRAESLQRRARVSCDTEHL